MILPMIDVPVSLIGTFAIMAAMGFTLNNLTLFGLVLAIGIVVDDAIVVLENIERLIATGLDARTATIQAMEEITGPILAITLVLSSVFIPCCFLGGISGQFFRQFAVTIAVSTIISAINAITMTPSRAVVIFRAEESASKNGSAGHIKREALPWWIFGVFGGLAHALARTQLFACGTPANGAREPRKRPLVLSGNRCCHFVPGAVVGCILGWFIIRPVNIVLGQLFRGFNRLFDRMTLVYGRTVGYVLPHDSRRACSSTAACLVLTGWQFTTAPVGFIPAARQGLPDSQRPVARRGRRGPHRARHGPDRKIGPRHAGREAYGRRLGPIADLERQRAQPGLAVCLARGIRQAARRGLVRGRHCRDAAGTMSASK